MLRIAICDDDRLICDRLLVMIRDYIESTKTQTRLDVYNSALDLTEKIENVSDTI